MYKEDNEEFEYDELKSEKFISVKRKGSESISSESSEESSETSSDDSETATVKTDNFPSFVQKHMEDLNSIRKEIKLKKVKKGKQNNLITEIESYTPEDFIKDLTVILDFDMSSIKENSPLVYKDNLYFYDESLERNVHLYEHIIFLSKEYCRPGLIRLLTWVGQYETSIKTLYSNPIRFNSMMSFISLQQGDYEYFEKTWRGLLQSLGVSDSTELPIELRGKRMLYLLKGSTYYTSLDKLSWIKEEYTKLFRKIFTKKADSLTCLHKFATFDDDQVLYLFKNKIK